MKKLSLFVGLVLAVLSSISVHAQGTAFIYQGQIRDGGTNANGNYTMTFKLYDAVSAGNQVGSNIVTSATLVNGIFSVSLDFGGGAFNGSSRWLETTVNNGSTTETISPRAPLLPAPYAQYANKANSLDSGTWSLHTGDFEDISNVFQFFDDGIFVLGMSTNGCLFNGNLDASQLHADSLSVEDQINVNNGGSIYLNNTNNNNSLQLSSDGNRGLYLGGSRLTFNDGSSLLSAGQGGLQTSGATPCPRTRRIQTAFVPS